MLERLSDISWGDLRAAYGAADKVPDLLRGFAQHDRDASYELWGTIWHQHTIYEVTAVCVPFLLDIASEVPGMRAESFLLLADIGRSAIDRNDIDRGASSAASEAAVRSALPDIVRLFPTLTPAEIIAAELIYLGLEEPVSAELVREMSGFDAVPEPVASAMSFAAWVADPSIGEPVRTWFEQVDVDDEQIDGVLEGSRNARLDVLSDFATAVLSATTGGSSGSPG